MTKFKKGSWLLLFIVAAMLLCLVQAVAATDDVMGFVPNSGEASVSKVNLLTNEEVARYYTAPRDNPYSWRTSRIAIDNDGNAWVINTGADGSNLQGSIVRIQANTQGLTTNTNPGSPLPFGDDQAVQVFNVGGQGDIPRAIAIDDLGFIWVGFYKGGQLVKYKYNAGTPATGSDPGIPATLEPQSDELFPAAGNVIGYYDMKFAPDGTLFICSRASTPTVPSIQIGIWTFNPAADPEAEPFALEELEFDPVTGGPYSILIASGGTVYATSYDDKLNIRDNTGHWTSVVITGSIQNRGMAFDKEGNVWIASTAGSSAPFGGSVVYQYIPGTGVGDTYFIQDDITTPVGLGMDNIGNMWVVCRNDAQSNGWLVGFNPANLQPVGAIQVGYRPYAYEFTVISQIQELSALGDFVWNDVNQNGVQDDGEQGIADVTVELYDCEGNYIKSETTDEDGYYLFDNLEPGSYKVKFILPDGTYFFSPQDLGGDDEKDSDADPLAGMTECVTLAAGETNPTIDAGMYRVFDDETAWVSGTQYVSKGNWATYVSGTPTTLIIYAGQNMVAGEATFTDNGDGTVTIDIVLTSNFVFADVEENLKVQDYGTAPSGNPSPGTFVWKATCTGTEGSITVPVNSYYGVHLDVGQWLINPNYPN